MRKSTRMRNRGEWKAALFLRRQGQSILAHNIRIQGVEVDLVSLDSGLLRFIEVKQWRNAIMHPLESQHRWRRNRVRSIFRPFVFEYVAFLKSIGHKPGLTCQNPELWDIAFDLIWVKMDGIEYHECIF